MWVSLKGRNRAAPVDDLSMHCKCGQNASRTEQDSLEVTIQDTAARYGKEEAPQGPKEMTPSLCGHAALQSGKEGNNSLHICTLGEWEGDNKPENVSKPTK